MTEDKIIELLRKHEGNATAASRELGMHRQYVQNQWVAKSDRVRAERDRLVHERRLNRI